MIHLYTYDKPLDQQILQRFQKRMDQIPDFYNATLTAYESFHPRLKTPKTADL